MNGDKRMSGNAELPPPLVDPRPLLQASAVHLLVWVLVAATLYPVDVPTALGVLLGAAIAVVPAAVMARAVFRFRDSVDPRVYTRTVYRGELTRFLLTIVLFALVFTEVEQLQVAALFLTYMLALFVQWALGARYLLR